MFGLVDRANFRRRPESGKEEEEEKPCASGGQNKVVGEIPTAMLGSVGKLAAAILEVMLCCHSNQLQLEELWTV